MMVVAPILNLFADGSPPLAAWCTWSPSMTIGAATTRFRFRTEGPAGSASLPASPSLPPTPYCCCSDPPRTWIGTSIGTSISQSFTLSKKPMRTSGAAAGVASSWSIACRAMGAMDAPQHIHTCGRRARCTALQRCGGGKVKVCASRLKTVREVKAVLPSSLQNPGRTGKLQNSSSPHARSSKL